jgi:Flp pilus assembly protein TadD
MRNTPAWRLRLNARENAPRATSSGGIVAWGGLILGFVGTVIAVFTYTTTRSDLAEARAERATAAYYEALDLLGARFDQEGFMIGAIRGAAAPDARRLEEARRAIERFASLVDDESQADFLYFMWAMVAGNLDLAREVTESGRDSESDVGLHLLWASFLANRFGQKEASYAVLDRAIELDPMAAVAYATYGAALHSYNEDERAIEMLRKAVELDPSAPSYTGALGHVLAESDRAEEASALLEAAIGLGVASAEVHNELGVAYSIQGQVDRAEQQFRLATTLEPTRGLYYANLSHSLRQLGETDEADAVHASASQWWNEAYPLDEERLPMGELRIPDFFE